MIIMIQKNNSGSEVSDDSIDEEKRSSIKDLKKKFRFLCI